MPRHPAGFGETEPTMSKACLSKDTVLAALIAIALLALAACGKPAQEPAAAFAPPAVSVAEVVVRELTLWDEFHGHLEAKEVVEVRPRVAGVIESVSYREGAVVNQGELLFVLDQQPFRAELARAEAELARASAQAELAHAESQRAANLFERRLISPNEYDQRIAAETAADADVQAAKAALRVARLNLEYTEVRSPIQGRAGRAHFTRGNLVATEPTADVLTTVVSLDPIYVVFDSDELSYLRYSKPAAPATPPRQQAKVLVGLSDESGFPHEGELDFIDNRLDPATGTIRLRATLGNKDHTLVPGLFARVKLLANAPARALLIDDKAVLTDQDRKFVYVLGADNQALRRDIEIGRAIEGLRLVRNGLQAGDRIIVHGVQKVFFPGMEVVPHTIVMGDPPPAP